jgi:nicotinamide-nucleotide amidase
MSETKAETLSAAILTIGSELLCGDGVDTNSAWFSRRLTRLGIDCVLHLSCSDDMDRMLEAIRFAAAHADVVIITGGLGPTTDDLTRQAVARWADVPLVLDEPSLEHIQGLFARFGRDMPESNRVQAEIPQGAQVLRNDVGTATCFRFEREGTLLFALPGVPREAYWAWDTHLQGPLRERSGSSPLAERTFRTVGISESALGEWLAALEGVEVRYAAEESKGTIRVTLLAADQDVAQDAWLRAKELAGKHICALGNDLLPEALAGLLRAKRLTVATAESCTGGRVAAALTGIPGVSSAFEQGFVTYSNQAKTDHLGVAEQLFVDHGAVSKEVALAMARGVRERTGSSLGLGVTGIAGPGGGTDDKPVGLVHMAVAGPGEDDIVHLERRYPGTRQVVQSRATAGALDLIRRAVVGHSPER